MWDPYAEFESTTLPNGLTVHAAHWPGRPWQAMGFLIHSGAEHDPVGLEGLSHFVEHMVSQNISLSNKDIHSFFDGCGGMVDLGVTRYPATEYTFFAPADKTILAKAVSMFGEMLLQAKLQKFFERERHVIMGEFHRHYSIGPKFELDMRRRKALYGGHWLERFVRPLGSPESINRITEGELQTHYDVHYTPANISIVGVGGTPLSSLVELLSESSFATSKKGTRMPLPTPISVMTVPTETHHV